MKKEINNKSSKLKIKLFDVYIIISLIILVVFVFISPSYFLIMAFLLIIPYLIFAKRKALFYCFTIAFLLSLTWTILAKNHYEYNINFLKIAGINTFPLFAWTLGLLSIYVVYSYFERNFKEEGYVKKILIFIMFYWPILIFVETFSYYLLGIHNLPTSVYNGLPICNCIHAPPWMQISYFLMGPLYFTICYLFNLRNPVLINKF